jgi:hypothetical protein
MNISEHITYREAVYSRTAVKKKIKNIPNESQLAYMKIWAEKVFEPLRKGTGNRSLQISSFFRSFDLNDKLGGSPTSQHLCNHGAAGDIDNDNSEKGPTNREIFYYIQDNLEFDQLIWEYGDNTSPDWVHVSYHEGHNRNQVLRCINGDYIFI